MRLSCAPHLHWRGEGIIQINRVIHTGADGYRRLALPALFGGGVKESEYFLVDDLVGQGGTLANLKGFVEGRGRNSSALPL
jgi:hypothetical protein